MLGPTGRVGQGWAASVMAEAAALPDEQHQEEEQAKILAFNLLKQGLRFLTTARSSSQPPRSYAICSVQHSLGRRSQLLCKGFSVATLHQAYELWLVSPAVTIALGEQTLRSDWLTNILNHDEQVLIYILWKSGRPFRQVTSAAAAPVS